MKTIQVDDEILQHLAARAEDIGESVSKILRRELNLPPLPNAIEVDDDVYRYLVSKMRSVNESASQILRRELHLATPAPSGSTRVVEFRIPAATGAAAWNTRENAVEAKVGDVLRIYNDDTVPHRLHTSGKPFPHPGGDVAPGASADFPLVAAFEPGATSIIYDHNYGANAAFWIRVSAS